MFLFPSLPQALPRALFAHLNVALPPCRPSSSISRSYCCPPLPPPPSTGRCKGQVGERRMSCKSCNGACGACKSSCPHALVPSPRAGPETHPSSLFRTLTTTVPSTHVSGPESATHTEAPTSMLLRVQLRLFGVGPGLMCVARGEEASVKTKVELNGDSGRGETPRKNGQWRKLMWNEGKGRNVR